MTEHQRRIEAEAGTAKIMWALASAPFPLTVKQCTEWIGLDPTQSTHRSNVSSTLNRLEKTGLVMRRQVPGTGSPYEYVVDPSWSPSEDDR